MEASQPEVEKTQDTLQGTVFSAGSQTEPVQESVATTTEEQPSEAQQPSETKEPQTMDLSDVEVTNENIALNIIVSYVNLAQKRGAFNMKESAKIWECIQKFQRASA